PQNLRIPTLPWIIPRSSSKRPTKGYLPWQTVCNKAVPNMWGSFVVLHGRFKERGADQKLTNSEHAIFVDAILWHGLSEIPEFNDLFLFETKNVHHRGAQIAGLGTDPGVDGDQAPVLQGAWDLENL